MRVDFFRSCIVYYAMGNKHAIEINPDRWGLFEATGIVKGIIGLKQS